MAISNPNNYYLKNDSFVEVAPSGSGLAIFVIGNSNINIEYVEAESNLTPEGIYNYVRDRHNAALENGNVYYGNPVRVESSSPLLLTPSTGNSLYFFQGVNIRNKIQNKEYLKDTDQSNYYNYTIVVNTIS